MRDSILIAAIAAILCTPALADPEKDAERLYDEAHASLNESCQPKDCPIWRENAAKLKRSYALHPSREAAELYCGYFLYVVKQESAVDAIPLCDVAVEVFNGVGDGGEPFRAYRRKHGQASSAADAALALYGVGMTVGEDADGKPTLAYGTLTKVKMAELVRDHLYGAASIDDLADPVKKLAVCKEIAGTIGDAAERTATEDRCDIEAAREANARRATFGGATGVESIERHSGPAFRIDDQLAYSWTFVIATGKPLDTVTSLDRQRKLLDPIVARGKQHAHHAEAVKMLDALDTYVKEHQTAAKKIWKQIAKKKKGVTFLPRQPAQWDVPSPVTKQIDSCADLYIVPPWCAADGCEDNNRLLFVSIDGDPCTDSYSTVSLKESCRKSLDPPGKHEIAVAIHPIKWFKTGDKRITVNTDSISVRDDEDYKVGKRISLDKITCGK